MSIPFVELGFTREGCHCWGLVWLAFKRERKIELSKYDSINATQIRKMLHAKDAEIARGPWKLVEDNYQPFDVMTMTGQEYDEDGKPRGTSERHVGIVAGPRHVLHTEEGFDTRCSDFKSVLFSARKVRVFRYDA